MKIYFETVFVRNISIKEQEREPVSKYYQITFNLIKVQIFNTITSFHEVEEVRKALKSENTILRFQKESRVSEKLKATERIF